MKAKFFINKSDSKKVDKELDYLFDFDITLKTASDLIRPTIDLQVKFIANYPMDVLVDDDNDEVVYDDFNIAINRDICVIDANYCYIEALKRYYYIDNFILVTPELYRLSLIEDELMSLKTQFRALTGFVTRNEFQYNPKIKDDLMNFRYNKSVIKRSITNLSSVKAFNTSGVPCFIASYLTNDGLLRCEGLNGDYNVPTIADYQTANNISSQLILDDAPYLYNLAHDVYEDDTYLSFIKSIIILPFTTNDIPRNVNAEKTTFNVGDKEINLGHAFKYPKHAIERFLIADFMFDNCTEFLNFAPFTKYELWLPYHRFIELDQEQCSNCRIQVYYLVNFETGEATVYVYNATDDVTIYQAQCTLGVRVSLSASNTTELNNQKISLAMNTAISLIGSAMAVGTGNPLGFVTGAKAIGNAITGYSQMYQHASQGATSSVEGLNNPQEVFIRQTITSFVGYDLNYFKIKGRPLNQSKLLSQVSGYTEIGDILLDNINATEEEKRNLKALLTNGIIL